MLPHAPNSFVSRIISRVHAEADKSENAVYVSRRLLNPLVVFGRFLKALWSHKRTKTVDVCFFVESVAISGNCWLLCCVISHGMAKGSSWLTCEQTVLLYMAAWPELLCKRRADKTNYRSGKSCIIEKVDVPNWGTLSLFAWFLIACRRLFVSYGRFLSAFYIILIIIIIISPYWSIVCLLSTDLHLYLEKQITKAHYEHSGFHLLHVCDSGL